MSIKFSGISRTALKNLSCQIQSVPCLTDEDCYIASGPDYEILAVKQPDGYFAVELLEKAAIESSLRNSIRSLQAFALRQQTGRGPAVG